MFTQEKLPYSTDALEPFLSRQSLETHYHGEGKMYADLLNKMVQASPLGKAPVTLEEVMLNTSGPLSDNACQVYNHNFYFQSMCPVKKGEKNVPSGMILNLIEKNFENVENFQQQFVAIANNIFGSGYCWLVFDSTKGTLKIVATQNAQNPVRSKNMLVTPLICCDVWEHAYYLDYKEDRLKYLQLFMNHINWDRVNDLLR
eukprot:Rmarinus@m.8235